MTKINKLLRRYLHYVGLLGVILLSGYACTSSDKTTKAPTAVQQAGKIIASPNDNRTYSHFTLPNKMQVILVSDPTSQKSAAALALNVGHAQNEDDFLGMAHYLEHMLFLGTKNYPKVGEFNSFINENGGRKQGMTSNKWTKYYFSVKNNSFEEGLSRFADFFKYPNFDAEYVEREKSAVNSEYERRINNDRVATYDISQRFLNPKHPMSRFAGGNLASLQDKPDRSLHQALVDFYKQYYSANLMKLVLVSDLSIAEMKKLATQYFSEVPNTNVVIEEPKALALSPSELEQYIMIPTTQERRALALEFPIQALPDAIKHKTYQLIAATINSEMPGTLGHSLKQAGLINAFSSYASEHQYINQGLFSINFSLTEKGYQQKDDVIAHTLKYIALIKQNGIPAHVFDHYKKVKDNEFQFLPNLSAVNTASYLASNALDYPIENIINYYYEITAMNNQQIAKALAFLRPESMRIVLSSHHIKGTKELKNTGRKVTQQAFSNKEKALWLTKQKAITDMVLPSPNRFLATDFSLVGDNKLTKPAQLVNAGNTSLWYMPSKLFKEPNAAIFLHINSSLSAQDARNTALEELLTQAFRFKASSLTDEAGAAGIRSVITNNNGLELLIYGPSDKQNEYLRLLVKHFKTMAFKPEEFEQRRQLLIEYYQNKPKMPLIRQVSFIRNQLYQKNVWPDSAIIQALKNITIKDFEQFKQRFLETSSLHYLAFGNVDQQEIIATAEAISVESKRTDNKRWRAPHIQAVAGELLHSETVALIDNVAISDTYLSDYDKDRAQVLANLLTKIAHPEYFKQLRTEEQLAYALAIRATRTDNNAGISIMIETPERAPKAIVARLDKFKNDFKRQLELVELQKFNTIKQAYITQLTEPPKNIFDEANTYIRDWSDFNYQFDRKSKLLKIAQSIELAELKQFYTDLIHKGQSTRILVQVRGKNYAQEPFAKVKGN